MAVAVAVVAVAPVVVVVAAPAGAACGSGAGSGTLFGEIERKYAIAATRSLSLCMPANAILVPGTAVPGDVRKVFSVR